MFFICNTKIGKKIEDNIKIPTPLTEIFDDLFESHELRVFVKRDDLCHPIISGNKYRKLKYNVLEARKQNLKTLLSFGGAYSNHIRALAEVGKLYGFKTVGIIRGNELNINSNETLKQASEAGMEFIFVDRQSYKNKEQYFSDAVYVIPEGGSNTLALQGMSELIDEVLAYDFDLICTACGTGGTMAGLLTNEKYKGEILGFPVLAKASFLEKDISILTGNKYEPKLFLDYSFGGYGKHSPELLSFMRAFETKHQIPLEQVYTAKMFFGFMDLVKKGYFKKRSKIMLLHTGGLQGRINL